MKCKICGNDETHAVYEAREMFFGLRTPFQYFECNECKCVQIMDIPEDMSDHYPSGYYTKDLPEILDFSRLERLDEQNYLEQCINHMEKFYLRGVLRTLDCSFLDVGCGNAGLVRNLESIGLRRSVGIDAYLQQQHRYESGCCRVYEAEIFDLEEKFDIILFEHSFEHMAEHQTILLKAYELLNKNGVCIIRIPIASYAWNIYHTDWYQLDAPRHLILHSFKSLELLFQMTPFQIKYFCTDGSNWQFIRSELYKRGIPFIEQNTFSDYFTAEEIEHFEKLAEDLNKDCLGDQITILLEKQ